MLKRFFAFLAFVLLAIGCGPPAGPGPGAVVVGVSSELTPGVDIDRLHVVMRAGEEVIRDEVQTTADHTLTLPAEFAFEDLAEGARVEIAIEAFSPAYADTPILTRVASTEVVGDRRLLLRVRLEQECVVPPGETGCHAPQTCVAGACSSPYLDPSRLEEYTPSWSTNEPDICKPAGAGPPIVIIGEGQSDYLPLDELEEVQVEAGPQGGHHIWVAVRMKNLRQSGSITSITGHVPELGVDVPRFNVIFTFDQDEGGYCKLYGLRFQLDGDIDIDALLGKVVDVTVQISDPQGTVGVGQRSVTLSSTIL